MKVLDCDYSEYAGTTISVAEAKGMTKNYSMDDVQALIRAGEVPGCIYSIKKGAEKGKYTISKPHWLAFIAGKIYKEKRKTSNSTDQSELDV